MYLIVRERPALFAEPILYTNVTGTMVGTLVDNNAAEGSEKMTDSIKQGSHKECLGPNIKPISFKNNPLYRSQSDKDRNSSSGFIDLGD